MSNNREKALRSAAGLAGVAGLAAVFPPAAAAAGLVLFLKGARRYAQSGNVDDARDMVAGFSDVSSNKDR